MNRRGFISALIATAVLDPEKLLYVPGKKHISIPCVLPAGCDYYSIIWPTRPRQWQFGTWVSELPTNIYAPYPSHVVTD